MPKSRLLVVSTAVFAALACSAPSARAAEPSEKERELIAVLRSDAPPADKAVACKNLAIHGSAESVADLARFLSDEKLASWSRIGLEAIPGPAPDEAFRKALDSLQGKLLIGVINSIGVRRDAAAVDLLSARMNDQDVEIASAAAAALGKIGNPAATKILRTALAKGGPVKVRSAVAEGCVLCAERALTENNMADAVAIYDEVRKADVPRQRMLEATRGAIIARKNDGIPLLLECFRSPDRGLFQISLSTAREFPGKEIDAALATELARATPERGALLVQAMADRKATVVLASVLKAAQAGPKPVRIAAIGALGRVGDASCLAPLLDIALEADADVAQNAKTALSDLPGDGINSNILARLDKAQGKLYPLLIELVGQRRIAAIATLIKALDHNDKSVRAAALTSLGATVPADSLSVLITQVVTPKRAEDGPIAQQALKSAAIRMADREACAEQLATAFERAPAATKVALLQTLGAVGGTKALNTIGSAAKSSDPQIQDDSSRLLGEWMTADAAPVLLDLAKTGPGRYQGRALRGYLRIARQFITQDDQRVAMAQSAFEAAKSPADQKLVFPVLTRSTSLDALKLAAKLAKENAELKEEGTQAAIAIATAPRFRGRGNEARDILKELLDKVKLEIVKAEYGAGTVQKDVTEIVQKQAADVALVSLSSNNFANAFGGDPAPGAVKQLKIQYRINGKPGEATFADNAMILLPMPK